MLVALICAGSCAKGIQSSSRYMIDGLSLPPGATETSYRDQGTPGQAGHIIFVNFTTVESWEQVSKHFNSSLGRAGFKSALGNDFIGTRPDGSPKPMSISYEWWDDDQEYRFMLENNSKYKQGMP